MIVSRSSAVFVSGIAHQDSAIILVIFARLLYPGLISAEWEVRRFRTVSPAKAMLECPGSRDAAVAAMHGYD